MGNVLNFSNNMEYEIFQIAFGLLLLSEFCILIFTFMGSSSSSKEKKSRSDSGTLWLILLAWIGSVIISSYFRQENFPTQIRNLLLPHFVYYFGIILILLGIFIRSLAVWTLKHAFTHSIQTNKNQHLIKNGFYKFVRNPAYTGSILSLIGTALVYRHILSLLCVIVLCLLCYGIRIKVEEVALKNRFEKEFNDYCINTKYRLFPYIY